MLTNRMPARNSTRGGSGQHFPSSHGERWEPADPRPPAFGDRSEWADSTRSSPWPAVAGFGPGGVARRPMGGGFCQP
jgi:hypothetical protein